MKGLFYGLLFCMCGAASAAEKAELFQDEEIIEAVLTAPIAQAYEQREQDVRTYFPGEWTYLDASGESHKLDVSIRTRGNFRRLNCQLPPLRLNFKKSQVKGTLFAEQDKLKVVAPCKSGPKSQQNVLMEYMAYRIYEILSEQSYGTRLMRLTYIDSDDKLGTWTDLVFVIESTGDLAKRLNFDRVRVVHNEFDEIDQESSALVELFQLMIANNDYSLLKAAPGDYCCHNVDMFIDEGLTGKRVPIPFDFDMSGLVSADYAAPPEHLSIKSVRTRYYRGLCQPPEILDATIEHILSKEDEIMSIFEESKELSRLSRKRTEWFLGGYFEMLKDQKQIDKLIVGRCRGADYLEDMQSEEADAESRETAELD